MSGYNGQYGGGGGYPQQGQQGYPPYNNNYPQQFPNNSQQFPNNPQQFTNNSQQTVFPTPQTSAMLTPQFNHQQSDSSTSSIYLPTPQPNSPNNSDQLAIDMQQAQQPQQPQFHYGEVPKVQPRRYKKQNVKLTDGKFIMEANVPSRISTQIRFKDNEFTRVTYTACTCDPDEFQKEGYTLRQVTHGRTPTEIFIVITMYNEEKELFARTFYGVVKNIQKLCKRTRSSMWGPEGWKKVVVCVVSDGRAQINEGTENYLAAIGVYQKGIMRQKVNEKDVTAHIFEYSTQLCFDPDMKPVENAEWMPIQVLFCLKERNAKKINSHRWFFNAFGRTLNPTVCVLLDAGTKPGGNSIYHLWKAFDTNPSIGGACGEIVAMKGKYATTLLKNPLVAAQNFEYKMSNILDKPLESVFGYITVLPGAFSAYRYRALLNTIDPVTNKEVGPLHSYFMGEKHHQKPKKKVDGEEEEEEIKTGLFEANMYLAEDRILCFELVSKREENWVLHYVKSAYAETDVPDNIIELIGQRRRWLNGSFFASLFAIAHTFNIWRSSHSAWRKFLLAFEMFYQTYNVIFSWFALGNLYLTFHILGNSLATDENAVDGLWSLSAGAIIFNVLKYVYIALIILQFSMALGNKPKSARWAYMISTIFFALLMFYMLFAAGWITYKGIKASQDHELKNVDDVKSILDDFTFKNVIISLLSTYGLYLIASFLFFEPYHMVHSIVQYMLLVPFYVNVLNVYAFCNIHDVSWGTKGEPKAEKIAEFKADEEKPGEGTVVEYPDPDEEYAKVQEALIPESDKSKLDKETKKEPTEEDQKEANAMFRTYVVFSWMISNGALIGVITTFSPNIDSLSSTEKSNIYFAFILWSVAALAAFRFVGSCIYLILRLFTERLFDGLIK